MERYKTFKDFYPYYLSEHDNKYTKLMHNTLAISLLSLSLSISLALAEARMAKEALDHAK